MKRSEVRERLRKARATMECGGDYKPDCLITEQYVACGQWVWPVCLGIRPSDAHAPAASALLDGLGCDDLTEVGG